MEEQRNEISRRLDGTLGPSNMGHAAEETLRVGPAVTMGSSHCHDTVKFLAGPLWLDDHVTHLPGSNWATLRHLKFPKGA